MNWLAERVTFFWPFLLCGLAAVPVLILLYRRILRRELAMPDGVRLPLIQAALHPTPAAIRRRHIVAALVLTAFVLAWIAAARPALFVTVPDERTTVILVVEVATPARSQDFSPNRLGASKEAMRDFIAAQPPHVRIGLVAYGGHAYVAQAPSLDHQAVLDAVGRLTFIPAGVDVGGGIMRALEAAFSGTGLSVDLGSLRSPLSWDGAAPPTLSEMARGTFSAGEPGHREELAVILFGSSGQAGGGLTAMEAAQLAADLGVRIYTVGMGSATSTMCCSTNATLQGTLLQEVARITTGEYFSASNTEELRNIFQGLGSELKGTMIDTEEVTVFAAAFAGSFALLAGLLSLLWFRRLV